MKFSQFQQTKELIQEAEEGLLQKLERRLLRPAEEKEGESSDPLEGFGRKIQAISEDFKTINLRLLNLERRAAKDTDGKGFRSLSKTYLDPKEADDFAHEAHLKLVTILSEVNDVKASFKLLHSSASEALQPEGIPNFSNYVPYMARLTDLEQRLSLLPGREAFEELMGEIGSLKDLIQDVDSPVMKNPMAHQSAGLAEILQEIGTLKKQASDSRPRKSQISIQPNHAPMDIFPDTPTSELETIRDIPLSLPIDNNTELLKQAILTLQKSVSQKASRAEVDAMIATARPRTALPYDSAQGLESTQSLNDRLYTLSHEMDHIRKELEAGQKAVNAVDEHVETKDRLHQEALVRLKMEIGNQFEDLYGKMGIVAEDPDSAKTITGLKIVVLKLQKDLRELKTEGTSRRNSFFPGSKPPSGEVSPTEKEESMGDLVFKHEALLKQLSVQIAKIYADFEETQLQLQRQNENLLGGSLKQMEDLRLYVSSMMEKVGQGAKLSQNDLEKLNDVMSMLEAKGDKTEIRTKVDKMELKRTHRILSKRIEDLQKELKRSESLQQLPAPREDPVLIKTRFDHECLACGQEVPLQQWKRGWKAPGRFPETKFRLGPGFSKILPVLKELSDVYLTQRGQMKMSEGRFTPSVGERAFTPAAGSQPGSTERHYRVMTSNHGARMLHRRKESAGL